MAPMSRGKIDKTFMIHKTGPKDKRTKSDQNHRFQTFSQRISQVKIKPLRPNAKSRAHDDLADDECHFRVALDQWRDRAMSETFVGLARQLDPISQSLPQLLHHQDRVTALVLDSLGEADQHSLEPILDLLVQFVYDIGHRFEPFLDRTIGAISNIAAKRTEVESIEWAFTAIARILRYLSRSLVQDLPRVFSLMSPLLGKQHQRPFVCRFAAEALSFLVRKASTSEQHLEASLRSLVELILADLGATDFSQQPQYQRSIMFMFSEAVRGVSADVRSVAAGLLRPLLQATLKSQQELPSSSFDPMRILEGVLVSIIHNTNADGFYPLLKSLMEETSLTGSHEDTLLRERLIMQGSHLTFVVISTRKATRISNGSYCRQNWTDILDRISSYLDYATILGDANSSFSTVLLKTIAVTIQHSPTAETARVKSLVAKFRKCFSGRAFLTLCTFANDLDQDKFSKCASDELQKFIEERWSDYFEQIIALLPRLSNTSSFWRQIVSNRAHLARLEAVFQKLVNDFDSGSGCESRDIYLASAILSLEQQDANFKSEDIGQCVEKLVRAALAKAKSEPTNAACDFALSVCVKHLALDVDLSNKISDLWPAIFEISTLYAPSIGYLDAVAHYVKSSASVLSFQPGIIKTFVDGIIDNLHSNSHEHRLKALSILISLTRLYESSPPEPLILAEKIESSPFDFGNLRNISMHVRNLGHIAAKPSKIPWLTKSLCEFCFGLLHVRLTPIWDDACDALATISHNSNAQDTQDYIMTRAIERLNAVDEPSTGRTLPSSSLEASHPIRLTDFECLNLSHVNEVYKLAVEVVDDVQDIFQSAFRTASSKAMLASMEDRSQALRVLKRLSSLTERKSRLVVPIFLEWFGGELSDPSDVVLDSDDDTLLDLPPSPSGRLQATREDKKSMLSVFAQFENPKVLFRSEEVFSSLFDTLCIGDAELQRLALKVLFTWKLSYISPYETNLLNIMDDVRMRDELAVFLTVDDETTTIQREHLKSLIPVLVRLLYGRTTSKEGMKNRGGREARRKAVLLSLARFGRDALGQFIDIALHPLESIHLILMTTPPQIDEEMFKIHNLAPRKQLGVLNMILDILESLANLVHPFTDQIMNATLFCLIQSSRSLERSRPSQHRVQEAARDESSGQLKAIRQQALKCLVEFFNRCNDADFSLFLPIINAEVVRPRLKRLPIESAQGISVLLRLFSAFASSTRTLPRVLDRGAGVSQGLASCLAEDVVRNEVKLFVLQEILGKALNLLQHKGDEDSKLTETKEVLRAECAQKFLTGVSAMLAQRPGRDVVEAGVTVTIQLSPYLQQPTTMDELLEFCNSVLDLKTKNMSPRIRSQILTLLFEYLPRTHIDLAQATHSTLVDTLSGLFSYFLDPASRSMLCNVFVEVSAHIASMERPARICRKLNSFSGSKLDEPDLDARSEGFDMIKDAEQGHMTAREWRPIIHNLLFLLKDESEFSSMRLNATYGLRRFIQEARSTTLQSPLSLLVEKDILPAVFRGIRERSESIRQEYLAVLAAIVDSGDPQVKDLQPLLGTEKQSSFFASILHIQQHQRLLALRQLTAAAADIASPNTSKILLPLLETMLSQTDDKSQAVADEIIKTLEVVLQCLDWDRYRMFLQRTVQGTTRFESKKGIRTLGAVVNALFLANAQREPDQTHISTLARTLPAKEEVLSVTANGVLDKLLEFVHFKDENTVDLRVIVASAAVRLIMTFPETAIISRLPPILMDVTNVLRSKSQEARDAARKTAADIAATIGPQFFSFLIKQLRSSLVRGTQLHVLSYTVHSLLLAISSHVNPGDIDSSVPDLMEIILGDCFGSVAQDKEAQGFRSKMREVRKKALGYDSLERLAALVSPESVSRILRPIQQDIAKHRSEQDKADELLRRLREGLRQNKSMENQKTLILCFELLRESLDAEGAERSASEPSRDKIVAFSMDLLRRVIDKHEDLKTAHNLGAFVDFVTKALNGREQESQIAAMRLLTSMIKVPLSSLDELSGQYLQLTKDVLEAEVSTASPLAQAALRLSAAVLRERPNAVMKRVNYTEHLAYTLTRLKPDLHEPAHSHERDRQVGAFNLLKAALGRGLLINEVYDIMYTVREVMITSPEREIRTSARAVYSRFILDYYPRGGKAFEQQLSFLRKNLHCEIVEGRQSVLEVVDFVLKRSRTKPEVAQVIVQKFWDAVLDLLVADGDTQTSDMARLLLQKLFETADPETAAEAQRQLLQFTREDMPDLVRRAGYRGWKLWFESREPEDWNFTQLMQRAELDAGKISQTAKRGKALLVEDALECFAQLCVVLPRRAFSEGMTRLWKSVIAAGLKSAQVPIKRASMRLVNMALVDIAKGSTETQGPGPLLCCSGGLSIEGDDVAAIIDSGTAAFGESLDEACTMSAAQSLRLVLRVTRGEQSKQVVALMLARLSSVIRREDTEAARKLAALKMLSSIAKDGATGAVQEALPSVLLTLSNLIDADASTDQSNSGDSASVGDAAREVLTGLKELVGEEEFLGKMQQVQTTIKERREERRAKRHIEAVSKPEVAERKKAKKAAVKKAKRKEKNEMHAGRRRGF